ncbi:MAG: hypothetical protein KDA57_06675 [Planctomycetales bacterium]|nr:hypothetical protein [Planctomycetales bacterium]
MGSIRANRTCRFEQMEPRQLLAADLFLAGSQAGEGVEILDNSSGAIAGRVVTSSENHCLHETPGTAGVTIHLLDEVGAVVQEQLTDVAGHYQFAGLAPGLYAVHEMPVADEDVGVAHIGSGGGIAFDQNLIGEIVVEAGSDLVGYDFCNRPTDQPSETGSEQDHTVVGHTQVGNEHESEDRLPAGAVLRLLYPSQPAVAARTGLDLQSSIDSSLPRPSTTLTTTPAMVFELIGGSDLTYSFTWQLSVFDTARTAAVPAGQATLQLIGGTSFDVASWQQLPLEEGTWLVGDDDVAERSRIRDAVFGHRNAVPVAGDWDGDGDSEIGLFLDGAWYLDLNGNGLWDETDLWAQLGQAGDLPVTGDWDGDGKTDIGIVSARHRPSGNVEPSSTEAMQPLVQAEKTAKRQMCCTAYGKVHTDAVDHVFRFGSVGDIPVTGDWNGNGLDTIGVFRDGMWRLDVDGDGRLTAADSRAVFGRAGDAPVVGDWNGDGVDDLGVMRKGLWIVDRQGNRELDAEDVERAFGLGSAGDQPVVGDWNGDGAAEAAVYRGSEARGVRL